MATASNKKKIQRMEFQDANGISRKKWNHTFPPNLFIFIKLTLIVLIPIIYFVYSPLLFVLMICYSLLFFVARLSERSLNKSVIRSNHIKIPKFDSAISLILVIVALCGTFLGTTNKTKTGTFEHMNTSQIEEVSGKGDFKSMRKNSSLAQAKTYLVNLGSLLTGERNVFSTNDAGDRTFKFGMKDAPSDFVADPSELPDFESMDASEFENMGGGKGNFNKINFSMDNLPLEYTFSSALSSVSTVLIFSVSFFGLISLITLLLKRRRFNKDMLEIVVEDKIELLEDGELERILSFGEETEETQISRKEINQKIKEEHKQTLANELASNDVTAEEIEDDSFDENANIDDILK